MTKEEYIELASGDGPLPILLADGRMGYCMHHNGEGILIDAYRGNECEQIYLPYDKVQDAGSGALIQTEANVVTDDDNELDFGEACMLLKMAQEKGFLLIWTITTGTKDHGDKYVARPHQVERGRHLPLRVHLVADTLKALRDRLPPGLTWVNRQEGDDPVIVETWM